MLELILPPLHEKQALICQPRKQKTAVNIMGTKFGKLEYLSNIIPTNRGYIRFGDLNQGDFVFDENGKLVKVLQLTPIVINDDSYDVIFSDGNVVKCSGDHLWITETHHCRKNKARYKNTSSKAEAKTTLEILESLKINVGGKERPNHSIPCVSNPIEFPDQDLPLDPYVLGAWLAEGSYGSNIKVPIYTQNGMCIRSIEKSGFKVEKQVHKNAKHCDWYIYGLKKYLDILNVHKNKHVPKKYLIGSVEQRLKLLQGLMEDGTISKRGDCTFDNTNKDLADAVYILAQSLGIKCTRNTKQGKLYGVNKKLCYRVHFTTNLPVFNDINKLSRLRKINKKATTRYIVDIKKVNSVPMRCIKVDNPTHLYVTGYGCIPTHNSLGFSIKLSKMAIESPYPGREYLWGAPFYNSAKIGFKYFCRLLPKEIAKPNRSELSMYFPHNDNMIYFKGVNTDPENTIEGNAYHHIVLDEASKMIEQAYNSARTTTTKTKAQIDLITTPRGKNWVYQKYLLGQGIDPDYISYQFPTSANPFIDLMEIERARRSMPERLFQQYYEAMFVDVSMVFTQYNDCLYDFNYVVNNPDNELWIHQDYRKSDNIVIGVDWGKVNDSTVMTAWDFEDAKMVGFRRFKGYDYISAVKELYRFNDCFKGVEMNWHDKTGVGIAMDDLLSETDLPYEGVVFTNNSKSDMVNDLMFAFEKRDIKIPNWQNMKLELDSFEVKPTETGRLRYNAFEGMHDDIVCSMMLGHSCMKEYRDGIDTVLSIDDFANLKRKKGDYFDTMLKEQSDQEIWGDDL